MKIGVFTDGYLPQLNGVALAVYNSVKGLRERGHEVYVIAAKYPNFKNDEYEIRLHSVLFIKDLNLRVATYLPQKALLSLFKLDFDIIHGHSGGPITLLGFEVAKVRQIPYVFTYHTLFNQYTHYILGGKLITPEMADWGSRLFCNRFDHIVAPTPWIKRELLSFGVTKPITVIPSGIDIHKFDIKEKGFLHKELGLSEDKKILLLVGRYAKEKSIDFLINAFKFVAEKDDSSVLVLVGNGKKADREVLENLIKQLGLEKRVLFSGPYTQEEIAKVYADGYLFVFASASETQGMVIFEALASGLPLVAVSDQVFEGVIENEGNGILTDRDYKQYAEKILKLLIDKQLRDEMAIKAKQSAQKFSLEQNALELEKLYRKAIAKKKAKRMNEIIINGEIDLPVEYAWRCLTDLKLYPKYVKHVLKVRGPKELSVGDEWQDLSTMLWLPLFAKHKVAILDKHKMVGYDITFSSFGGGEMIQRVHLTKNGQKTKFNASIKFRINNRLLNFLISPVLKSRLKDTMLYTIDKAQKDREKLMA